MQALRKGTSCVSAVLARADVMWGRPPSPSSSGGLHRTGARGGNLHSSGETCDYLVQVSPHYRYPSTVHPKSFRTQVQIPIPYPNFRQIADLLSIELHENYFSFGPKGSLNTACQTERNNEIYSLELSLFAIKFIILYKQLN